jgi:hypothetical protein
MKIYNGIVAAILAGLMLTGLSGCEQEGPAERAGKAVDEAIEDTGEAIEDAQEKVEDAIEEREESNK